eukprot:CAMPEP_0172915798 /NCGR_PEP_ID=MMETSP1075-20121228/194986_1 /TAXON_ID=2916 /ORGANISM="Ceratium fusus, Strain PA161109" /LENGTH=180 /DNA_ID=CAMNT_0013774927 /DNA_START=60 /DNA_END=599 /DNA_ORIENTATION=+
MAFSKQAAANEKQDQGVALLQKRTMVLAALTPVSNFIAALQPDGSAGTGEGAQKWGLWVGDPGASGKMASEISLHAPAWYNLLDWWKEEHNLVMPNPVALPTGQYKVYGDTTVGGAKLLTVKDDGSWELAEGVTIDDVTHHPCKAYRYMGAKGSGCAADNEAACTDHKSPVEYRVLIVEE